MHFQTRSLIDWFYEIQAFCTEIQYNIDLLAVINILKNLPTTFLCEFDLAVDLWQVGEYKYVEVPFKSPVGTELPSTI